VAGVGFRLALVDDSARSTLKEERLGDPGRRCHAAAVRRRSGARATRLTFQADREAASSQRRIEQSVRPGVYPRHTQEEPMEEQVNPHHRDTLQKIFAHPASGNIEWREVRALLESIGAAHAEHNGKFKITIGDETEVVVAPRSKDIDQQLLVDLRRMLKLAGYAPESAAKAVETTGGAV
jgi:hypothetical protein